MPSDRQELRDETSGILSEIKELRLELIEFSKERDELKTLIERLNSKTIQLESENAQLMKENEGLKEENQNLISEVKKLRLRLGQDSQNSSKPPSSDPVWKRSTRKTTRKSTGRKPGGQIGHKGSKLKKFVKVDHHEKHQLSACPHCRSKDLRLNKVITRQVADIPEPRIEVTEHEIWKYSCRGCWKDVEGGSELDLTQEVQYGIRIKSLVTYLNVYQLLPYKRLTELIHAQYGIRISQGSISNFNKELQDKIQSFKEAAIGYFQSKADLLHGDETGCTVNKRLHWVHVYCDELLTLLFGHVKRGKEAMDSIGILGSTEATVIHDRFSSYMRYDHLIHGFCNAHILRDLTAAEEACTLEWPGEIRNLLLRAKEEKDRNPLRESQKRQYLKEYDSILVKHNRYYEQEDRKARLKSTGGKRGKPKRSKDHNLYRVLLKHRNELLRFITDPQIPFDNNQAERDLRMLKTKMKISNQFKTEEWMQTHLDIRAFVSTAVKQDKNILDTIQEAYLNPHDSALLAV